MPREFELRFEEILPASPEEVWAAIATGPGIDSWFMGRNDVEPREGGKAVMETGGRREEATVTAYEPGRRFATRTATGPDGRFAAFEYLIEGREGGGTVLRVVHSGMLGDDWQDEYDALRRGWPFHLDTLREYLAHFPGRTGVPVFGAAQRAGATVDELRAALGRALGLPAWDVGGRVHAAPDGVPPLDGEVAWADGDRLKLRTTDGLYSFFLAPGLAAMFHHLFGPTTEGTESAWQGWLATTIDSL
jgi:uncharacterized protein YndB with AHSA1/START domain